MDSANRRLCGVSRETTTNVSFHPIPTLEHSCVTTLKTMTTQINCLAVHNGLLYAASINEINVFDLSDNTLFDTFSTEDFSSGSIKSVAFNGTKIFTAHQDRKIRVWRIAPSKRHQLVTTIPTVKDRLRHFMLPKNYVNVRRHKKRLWVEHWDAVCGLVVHGGLMYSVSWDKSFKVWNTRDYRCLESVNAAHEDAVCAVVVSNNGTVYTGSADGLIKVWEKIGDERRHSLVATLVKHKSTVNALALTDDGLLLFSGGCDRSIMVWERSQAGKRHEMVDALRGHTGAVLCLINLDRLLVSGSSDRTVRIWQHCKVKAKRYYCTVVLKGHESPVKSLVSVTTAGDDPSMSLSICSGSLDGEIKIWEVSAQA